MTVLVGFLLAVVILVAVGGEITRVTYLRKHPVSPPNRRVRSLKIGLVVLAAAVGLGVGIATSSRGVTVRGVVTALVMLAAITLYALWRFTSAKDATKE